MKSDGKELRLSKSGTRSIAHEHVDRVTDDALLRVMYEEEARISEVFEMAKKMAIHAGRKTVTEDDVMLVYQMEDGL